MSIEELVIQLQAENNTLQEQNAELGQQNAELVQLIHGLREQNTGSREQLVTAAQQVTELGKELAHAVQRIAELEQVKKEPPSFIKPNRPKREGPPTSRRQRAQEHNHGRKRAEVITHRVEHTIERCPECDCMLRKKRVAHMREGIDIPPPQQVEVTEHVVYKGYCPRCVGWKYAAAGEAGAVVGHRRFGTRVMAVIGFLTETLRLTNKAIQSYLKTIHGLEISEGAIVDLLRGLAKKLQPVATALKAQIRGSAIVHADETGWRENGQNGWVWVFSTPGEQGIRSYIYDHSRGHQVVEAVLGESFQGVLASDFYGAYNAYTGPHQRCWVHLLRDMHKLKEEYPEDTAVLTWVQELRSLYDRAITFVDAKSQRQGEGEKLYVELVNEVDRLGLMYAREKHPCRALSKRVLRHQDELFQFVRVAGLAADNNLAERSLRPLVVVRKISGGTRSSQGSQTRMTLASVFATLKARGLNPFTECLALIRAN